MKLLYIANARFPTEKAHGIQIAKMWEAFVESGHEVELILPRRKNNITDDPITFYNLAIKKENVNITEVWAPSILFSTRIGFLLSSLIFGITSVNYARKQKGILYSVDLDYFSFFLIPFLKRPYFFEIHSAKKNTFFHRSLFNRISGVIAINGNVERALKETFPSLENKIVVHPNGVDVEARRNLIQNQKKIIEARARLHIQEPSVIYTGSFQGWKGLDTIVDTATSLPHVHFYLVGGKVHELGRSEENIPKNVVVRGPQKYADMPVWQGVADILLVTGTKKDEYSYNYTSPMKLFEYMGTGRPIIAARTEAIKNVVKEDIVTFYEPDNAESLAKTIQYVLDHNEEMKEKSEKALLRSNELSYKKRAVDIITFISRAI